MLLATLLLATFVTTSDGARIEVLERACSGDCKAPALVFVPGFMMPARIWERQLEGLAPKHRVLAISPRSQGDSSKETEGHYPAMRARDLEAVLAARNLDRVVLVGASSGVADVVAYIDRFGTARVAGVILVHGVPGADHDAASTPGLLQWAQRFQTDRRARTEALVRSLFKTTPPPALVDSLVADAMKMPTSAAIATFFGTFTSDLRPALKKIDKPALIIVGESPWMTQYKAMQDAIAGAELVLVSEAGHAVYLDAPQRFNELVAGFVRKLQ